MIEYERVHAALALLGLTDPDMQFRIVSVVITSESVTITRQSRAGTETVTQSWRILYPGRE